MSANSRLSSQPNAVELVDREPFTVERANRSLVLVGRVVADIRHHYQRVLDLQELLQLCQQDRPEQAETVQMDLCDAMDRLQACADELAEIGVDLRDWSAGVVDFPACVDGRERHLCWRFGEPSVSFWHGPFTECQHRQPLAN